MGGGVQICEGGSKSACGYGPGGSKSAVTPADNAWQDEFPLGTFALCIATEQYSVKPSDNNILLGFMYTKIIVMK